jgi:hypothetical protein
VRRVTAVLCAIVIGALAFLPGSASAAVGGCAGGEDYNGDGFADLAIGVPGEDIGAVSDAGAVQIIYGGSGGLSSAGDQVFHQDTDGMNDAAEPNDAFGNALASGDFDGDGFDDLAVGVPRETIGAEVGAGAVQIIYGTATGLSASGDQVFHRGTLDVEDDPEDGDEFGKALAACDFDGDGQDDLAIGVPFDDVTGESDAGSVNVLYGGAGGLSAVEDDLFHQDVLNDAVEAGDEFGRALAGGDFDADGRGDLAVGVPRESIESLFLFGIGAVQIVYGSDAGLSDAGNGVFHQDTPGMNETGETDDLFGWSLASGDFDGDGFDDLTIGVPLEDIAALENAGAIQVMYGSPGGLSSSGDQVFHQESSGMNDTSEPNDLFGWSLASGDFDDDGFDDAAVGVLEETVGAADEAGALHIIYGTSGGLSSAGDRVFHQDSPGMNDTAEHPDQLGGAVTSGDFDGDGFDDLAAGAAFEGLGGSSEGAVQIVYGTSAGLSSAGDQIFHQNSAGMNDTAETDDKFGAALVGSPFV